MFRPIVKLAGILCVAAGAAAGCGAASTPPTVQLSITAPVNGASVVVPGILVTGTVEPKNAAVTISGRNAQVKNGVFRSPILLRARLTRIRIAATAHGYVSSVTEVAVGYSPRASSRVSSSSSDQAPAAAATSAGSSGSTLPPGSDAAFVTGCTSGGASDAACVCVWRELIKRGFTSESQWEALIVQWRRTFLSKGVIEFPRALRDAVVACGPEFREGFG